MSMTYFLHDGLEAYDTLQISPAAASQYSPNTTGAQHAAPKLKRRGKAPVPGPGLIERPRLTGALARVHEDLAATLITGRAGTGKTSLAAQYAAAVGQSAWLELDTPDVEWDNFAAYLMSAVAGAKNCRPNWPTGSRVRR
jgi:hypothetical protein